MFLECNLCLPRRKTLSFPWWKKYYLGYFNWIKGNTLTKQSFKMIKAFLQFTRPEKGHTLSKQQHENQFYQNIFFNIQLNVAISRLSRYITKIYCTNSNITIFSFRNNKIIWGEIILSINYWDYIYK